MRFPWDEDDSQVRGRIQANLAVLFPDIVASGRRRDPLTIDLVKDWHQLMLGGIPLAQPEVAGGLRGSGPQEGRLRTCRVTVDGILQAVPPGQVRSKMSIFERRLHEKITALDPLIPAKAPPEQREEQVLELCAWGHGELVYVHPFADGNGRMARSPGAVARCPVRPSRLPGPPTPAKRSIRVRDGRESLNDWSPPAHADHLDQDAGRLPSATGHRLRLTNRSTRIMGAIRGSGSPGPWAPRSSRQGQRYGRAVVRSCGSPPP
jgi:Fic/DOC family